jgi:hypothetical protein
MPIDLENKQREAASCLQNGEPGSMDRDKDCRPEHSSGILAFIEDRVADDVLDLMPAKSAVYFQGTGPLHIPRALLHQSAKLPSRDVATGCCSSPFREFHLNDIAYDTGHVLIHFIATGNYQCLKPQGDTTAKRYASEFATALRAYVAAESLQLPSLRDLARREMIRLGDKLSLPSLIDIMEESSLSLSTLPGIAAYVESRILAFAENVTHPTSEKVLSEIGTPNTFNMVLLKTILLLQTSEVHQRDESLRKEELVEILRSLTDSGPIPGASRSRASDVNLAMKEAEEQAAREAEEKAMDAEKAAAAGVAVAQRVAAVQADEAEAVDEEEEIALLLAKG